MLHALGKMHQTTVSSDGTHFDWSAGQLDHGIELLLAGGPNLDDETPCVNMVVLCGCGSKPMVPFWGRCTTHFSLI